MKIHRGVGGMSHEKPPLWKTFQQDSAEFTLRGGGRKGKVAECSDIARKTSRIFSVAADGETLVIPVKFRGLPLSARSSALCLSAEPFPDGRADGSFMNVAPAIRFGRKMVMRLPFSPIRFTWANPFFSERIRYSKRRTEAGIQFSFENRKAFPGVEIVQLMNNLWRCVKKSGVLFCRGLEIAQDVFRIAVSQADIAEFAVRVCRRKEIAVIFPDLKSTVPQSSPFLRSERSFPVRENSSVSHSPFFSLKFALGKPLSGRLSPGDFCVQVKFTLFGRRTSLKLPFVPAMSTVANPFSPFRIRHSSEKGVSASPVSPRKTGMLFQALRLFRGRTCFSAL